MFEIEIKGGAVSKEQVHIFMSAPPNLAPSEIMRRIKGRSARKLFEIFPELKKSIGEDIFGQEDISV